MLRRGLLLLALLTLPTTAAAYVTPEDILLNAEFFAPPRNRESQDRVADQQERSAERRQAEQDALHPAPVVEPPPATEPVPTTTTTPAQSTSDSALSPEEEQLLRALKLLERRDERVLLRVDNQQAIRYYDDDRLHTGAPPPLQPTGAGAILSLMTLAGAVGWTMWRAKRREVKMAAVGARSL